MRVLKEPLLHFMLIGAALFVGFDLVNRSESGAAAKRIVVSSGRVEQLSRIFGRTWQRPPTAQELKGLIDDFVLEEAYYREGIAMGIDQDDTMIRRRLRQKLEFLTEDAATLTEPSEEELAVYFADHEDQFRMEPTYTFRQIYFNPEHHGDEALAFISEQAGKLRAGQNVDGDQTLLPPSYEDVPRRQVNSAFGSGFAENLDELRPHEWSEPILSGLGVHLVQLESRTPGYLPELPEILPQVKREWANRRRQEFRREFDEQLLSDYEVVIEWPEAEGKASVQP
jgi:hypothetical protein